MINKTFINKGLVLLCFVTFYNNALAGVSFQLFDDDQNRSKVIQVAYAYYPVSSELRVQLTLENRQVKYGSFSNETLINNILTVLSQHENDLYCSYEGNAIIAIGRFSNLN